MPRKPETKFRVGHVAPFLKTLKKCAIFPISQITRHDDPDYLLCLNSEFVALELKIDTSEPRPLQQKKLDWVRDAGGISLVAKPSNWGRIKEILLSIERGTYDQTNE